MPCGTKQPTNRGLGVAAVWASAVAAGIIASSNGSASAAPLPLRIVRREMCLLVINMFAVFLLISLARSPLLALGQFHIHLERSALHDPHDDGRKLVFIARRIAYDRPYGRHILILHAASQRVGQHLLGDHA